MVAEFSHTAAVGGDTLYIIYIYEHALILHSEGRRRFII